MVDIGNQVDLARQPVNRIEGLWSIYRPMSDLHQNLHVERLSELLILLKYLNNPIVQGQQIREPRPDRYPRRSATNKIVSPTHRPI